MPRREPTGSPTIHRPRASPDVCSITAIGHSAFLLQVGGLNVLTDPVFAQRASPFQWAGPRRVRDAGLLREQLPPIDLVLQSHDHYDHLDLDTARWLARRDPEAAWCVPLGVARRLARVGVTRLVERDWWEAASIGEARVTCVPAAHFSGRTPFDRDATLWCGWSLEVRGHRLYFVGDTGLHPEFGAIGERLGGWDAVLMPIGAYAPRWFMRPVHLDPDDALAAFEALTAEPGRGAPILVAMHWGTFVLSDEPLDEPVARIRGAWADRGHAAERLWVLPAGETRVLSSAR
jgi:N-acyl-phosphatidylethanolamine-hydrolysing phospholipase D